MCWIDSNRSLDNNRDDESSVNRDDKSKIEESNDAEFLDSVINKNQTSKDKEFEKVEESERSKSTWRDS